MKQEFDLAQALNTQKLNREIQESWPTARLCRSAAAEGIILLKNEGVLPLKSTDRVAVFGRCAQDYQGVGYGSGGDVRRPYLISLLQGLKNSQVLLDSTLEETYSNWIQANPAEVGSEWGKWPMSFPEMDISKEDIEACKNRNDVALVVIGRVAGEDRDNKLEKGSYYLTEKEELLLANVTNAFSKVVLILNIGNGMDLSFLDKYLISSVVLPWQGGMEGGNALADVLTGKVNPCGKLPMTFAKAYEDYPSAKHFGSKDFDTYYEDIFVGYRYFTTFAKEKIRYPFGYGLSYSKFLKRIEKVIVHDYQFEITVFVENQGDFSGKEVVQIYLEAPQGSLGKASKVLCAFSKTKCLGIGETETLKLRFNLKDFASYDDTGITGHKHSFVLEAGSYILYLGENALDGEMIYEYKIKELIEVLRVEEATAPKESFSRLVAKTKENRIVALEEKTVCSTLDLKRRILENLPEEIPFVKDTGITLWDVKEGKHTLEEFMAQLTEEDLEILTRGYGPMNSPFGMKGNAGSFGGSTERLQKKGIPAIITTDGPSGIRLEMPSSLLPCGTALASTFDVSLIEELYQEIAVEMLQRKTDVLLAPGMNIQRNPLCGRNFEYFSEDPILSGLMGAAVVRGIQQKGLSACPKHFACNQQEYNRNHWEARISERALREIYLKNFEICIREGKPNCIMTSYNKINGVWSHYNYEMVQMILYEQWKYQGCVITDWWMQYATSQDFPKVSGDAYRVRAHVSVLMPGQVKQNNLNRNSDGSLLRSLLEEEGITRGEIQRAVKDVLHLAMHTRAFLKNDKNRR